MSKTLPVLCAWLILAAACSPGISAPETLPEELPVAAAETNLVTGSVENADNIWPEREITLFAATFKGTSEKEGYFVLEPGQNPHTDVAMDGSFTLSDLPPGQYILLAGPTPEEARKLITETIRGVEGVLPDESIKVLCHEMGESAMVLRVWWWIADYDETAFVRDRVIEAVQMALEEHGFNIAHPIRDLNVRVTPETVNQLSRAFGNQPEESAANECESN